MSRNKFISNMVIGIFFAIFSACMIWIIIPNHIDLSLSRESSRVEINSQTFPTVACSIVLLASCFLLLSTIIKFMVNKGKYTEADKKISFANEFKAIQIYLLCVLYAILYMKIGFIIASIIVLPLTLFLLGSRKKIHYIVVYLIAIIMYLLFRLVLNVAIP